MHYDVAIIGSGPAGLFSALLLSKKGLKVLLIEKNQMVGRKLLMTGSKQCNLTSRLETSLFLKAYGEAAPFMKHALKRFSVADLMAFFEEIQVPLMTREDGKVFPKSLLAEDVVNALMHNCKRQGVQFSLNNKCLNVSMENNAFAIETVEGAFASDYLILATGGCAYPHLGSSGEAFEWIEKLGHTVVPPRPALTPVFVDDFTMASLSGLSFKACLIDVTRNGQTIHQMRGDLLITHFGLSGPVILNNSRAMAAGDRLRINFTGEKDHSKIKTLWQQYLSESKSQSVRSFFEGYGLPKRFVDHLLAETHISSTLRPSQWTKEQRETFFEKVLKYPFDIHHLGDLRMAMVTAGGVSRCEVDSKTMSSKVVRGLYFAGEVLDVDGETGGFNIQAAMSTAFVASEAIVKHKRKEA